MKPDIESLSLKCSHALMFSPIWQTARRQRKEAASESSHRANKKLVESLLKQHALNTVLQSDRGQTSGVSPVVPPSSARGKGSDIFELPPEPDRERLVKTHWYRVGRVPTHPRKPKVLRLTRKVHEKWILNPGFKECSGRFRKIKEFRQHSRFGNLVWDRQRRSEKRVVFFGGGEV